MYITPSHDTNGSNFVGVDTLIDRLSTINPLYNGKQFRPECMKSPINNLVWYRNFKAATTTYMALFDELGWIRCSIDNINWDQSTVFGHIRDPLTRYRKGLTQFFADEHPWCNLKMIDVINQPEYQLFVTRLRNVDRHCMSLEYMLGPLAKKVYWIPMDIDFDHRAHTLSLLEFFREPLAENLKNWWLEKEKKMVATGIDLEFYQQLEKIPVEPSLIRFLDFDQCLYDTAKHYFT